MHKQKTPSSRTLWPAIRDFFTQDWRTGLIRIFYVAIALWAIVFFILFLGWLFGWR